MSWEWYAILIVVRLGLVVVPMINVDRDFALGKFREEAKQYTNATSSVGLIITLPVTFFFGLLALSDKTCAAGVEEVPTSLAFVLLVAIAALLWKKLPRHRLRRTVSVAVVLLLVTGLEWLWQERVASMIVQTMCAVPTPSVG